MAVIGVRPRDEESYTRLRDHVAELVAHYGSCEMTAEAFHHGAALESIEMRAPEMLAHITDVISGKAKPMEQEPRNSEEFLQQMAKEIGCELSRPITRPWNVLFKRVESFGAGS